MVAYIMLFCCRKVYGCSTLYTAKSWKLPTFNYIVCQLYIVYYIVCIKSSIYRFIYLSSFSCRSTLCNDVTSRCSSHNTAEVVISYHIAYIKPHVQSLFFFFNFFNQSYILLYSKSGTQRVSRDDKRRAQHNEGYSVSFEISSSTS